MSKAYDYFREISANNNDMIMPNDTDVNGDTGRIHDATGVSEGLGGFLANLLMPGFSTALYRPSAQNFIGGLEGDAGGAANYLGAFAKSQGEIDPDTGWNSLGDWLINNGKYWNDRADDVQQQFGTLNRYQNEDILQRLTDTDYLTDSRGLMADVFNGAGSSVPFVVASSLAPEIGIGGALARGAGGLLERLGMSTAGRAVASDLVQSGANDFARYALTGGPLEAAINAGGIYDDLKSQGLSDSEIFGKMNSMIGEELPMDMLTSGLYGAVLGGNTFSRLGQGGWKRAIAANVLNTPADMLGEYMQEMTQQQLQNKYSGKPYGTFWNPTEDEMQAGRAAAMGTLPMGMFGSARGVRNSRRAAMAAADGGSVTGPEPVTPPAVPDPNVDPVEAAQLTGKNDDVPTADGVDVTSLDPQQYTQWYGDKLKAQGIDVPDATITVQTPQVQQTGGAGSNAKSGVSSYDASALEGAPQYTVSGEVSSTDVTPLTDQKMRLLDSAYYNKYGQHLYITSMKRNGNPDESWHNSGQAFDTADDNLANNKEARDWLVSEGEKLGLTPLDEYENPSAHATGGHIHFSDHGDPIPEGATQNTQAQNTQETTNNGGAPAADLSSLPVGDIATAIAQNTGLPANFIWAQLSHESDGGNSKLAREDHNYGGVKGNDGEYLHFDNDQEFVDYMSNYYPKYREDGIYDAQTADQFAEALQHGGYFTADLGEYEGGMHRYLEQAGLSDSGMAGAPSEKQSGGDNANTMTQQQFGDMLNEKMIDFAGTNDDTVKAVFNDMSTSKDKSLVALFAPYMQDGAFANTAANREALVGNDGFKKAMAMFLSKHLSDYAPAFENGRISFQQAEDALRPRHQVQAAQTAQAVQATQTPNIQTTASPKMEAAAIQNVLSSFVQGKKNAARTEQEADLFDDMLDADDRFVDTPKNRQTLLKNYGAQLQAYVDDVMTPSLNDRVNQAIEQAVQDKDLNRMNILTQAKQANDTATLEKLVGPQAQQHVDITAMLTPANANVENRVNSKVQETMPSSRPATAERQVPQSDVSSTVQGNTPVQQVAATKSEMPQGKVASAVEANMPVNQTSVRMDNQQAGQQDTPKKQDNVTPLPTQEAQQSEGVRIAQPQPTIDEQNAQMDARIAAIKKQPLAQRKALGQQYLDTLRQNNVSFSEKKLAKPLMDGEPEALEHVQRTYGDLLNTITPAESAAASQHTAPRTIQAATTARLANMVSEITSGNTYKNASPVGKLAYLAAASGHAKTVGADESVKAIDSIIADVRKKAGFSGKGTTEGMTPEQKDEFYNTFYKQSLDDATAIRKEAADEKPANLKSLDNTIEMFKQELANSKPTKEARKEVTHESTQSKNQQKPDEGTKNQDQHAEPEPRKAAEPQPETEAREVSATKKAADEGGQKSKDETKLSAAEEQTLSGTSDEAKQVYTIVRDQLTTSKSKGAQCAASVGAAILARHADVYAKVYSKATGKKYTAADYMHDKIGIDMDGNVVNDEKAKQFFQTAWHGSPHDFDQFDLGAIGTGEGAQVHGWGLYFAANREVSEGYKDFLSRDVVEQKHYLYLLGEKYEYPDGTKLTRADGRESSNPLFDDVASLIYHLGSINAAVSRLEKLKRGYEEKGNTGKSYHHVLDALKVLQDSNTYDKYEEQKHSTAHLYRVDIPDEKDMLEENKPYSEMSSNTRSRLKDAYKGLNEKQQKSFFKAAWPLINSEDGQKLEKRMAEIHASSYRLRKSLQDVEEQIVDVRAVDKALDELASGEKLTKFRYNTVKYYLNKAGFRAEQIDELSGNPKAASIAKNTYESQNSANLKELEQKRSNLQEELISRGREGCDELFSAITKGHAANGGRRLYDALAAAFGDNQREASLWLNKYGIKGIAYNGKRDGRCYVVFDDKAVSIINKYNQTANGKELGYTTAIANGKRIVTLLGSADESTFLHEMGHVFLLDLQDLAEIDQTSANDMAAVEGWAAWKKGQAKEYKGTAWEQEFADREKAIVKAMKDGDDATASQLKDEWMQERFARGFERYLESGEAPFSKLKDVFEKFKQFLTRIYNAFKGAGGKPSDDVKNVMARMMDSDVENTIKVPPMGKPIIGRTGNETTVMTDSGKTIRARYRLVPTARVITSHNAETLAPITYDDDGNAIPLSQRFNREIDDIRYSVKQNDAQVKRSLQAVVDEAKKAFPNAKNIRQDGGHISMDMPNGAEVQINVVPSIEVNNEEAGRARAAHGLKGDVRIKINGGERTVGRTALIELSQLGRKGTAYHEAFHAVYDMCLTNEEKAALHKAYDKEAKAKERDVYEVMADKYRDWMLAQQKGQHTLFGKLWQKVKSAVIRLLHLIRGADNACDVFRKVGSGEVWERQLNSKDSGNRYLVTNDQIRPDTEVPIIDVTDEPKVNVNNHHAAADIARSMIGKTFRIIGSDGYGKIASVSDGTHFVHSSNNPVRFDKTRRKALSVAEKILGNCVYIEKHGDLKHGTKQSYIEMFSVVKDGNRLVRFRIVAKEGNKDSHAFRIGEAKFYDIIKDGALQESGVLRHYKHEGAPSTLTITELLKGVKDREGHLYVNKDGSLNYDIRIFHNGEEQGGSPSDVRNSADLFAIRPGEPIRYSLDANDNSKPSLFTRAYNHLTGRKNTASHDKNVKAMLEDITKMRIRFGKLDPKTETVFKKFEGVIRARNANEWEKVLPEAGRAIADRLNLKPSEDMNNYIAKWLLDEATNDTSQEASDFATALKNDPVLSDQLVDLKTLFNERNNREADEVVRDAIQYEKPKERTTLTKAWETFYDEMIEELGPVKRMVKRVQEKSGQELATSVNPYIALRLFRGNAGRAMTMIEGQSEAAVKALQTNYPGVNFNGFKTLHMILDECGALHNEKRMKDFLAFALACHVKDIHTLNNRIRKSQQRLRDKIADLNDKINNLPEYQQLIESDKKVDDKYQEQREAYQKEIEGYQAKIDKAEKTIMEVPRTEDGLSLTEDRCNKVMMKYMKEYGEAQQDLVHFSKVTTSILYDAGVISKKRYKELQERWPNYIPMFRVFEDNEEVDFGDSLKHMHGSTRRIINPLDSIIRNTYDFVKKAEKNKARQLLANLTRISDVGEYIEEVDNSKPNDKTTITFYEDGKRKYLQTDPDIVKAVNNMGRAETNLVLRLLHAPAKIARACFTTINPSFALRNIIRDATDASIYSKYGFKPWDFVRGFLHAVHQDELFYEWLSSGAAQASAISLDRDYTQATLNQMTKTWKERLLSKKFLPAILEGMQMVGEYSEYGTRIAVYERAKKKLAGENGPHPAAYDLASAALESRDTADFARGGRGSRYLNNVVIFANASIQGFDKFFRTFDFRKPYRKESMKALARLFLCGMLPALLLAGIHSGDDWWEELPDWQKETNWILGKVGNTIIRIPKGQDIGLRFFSNLIEKAMDRSKHKAGDYFKPVWDSLPDMIPTALLPIIEATANHSYFTGAPVVPKYQEKLPAYLQFGNETSSFAKFVGKVIGVSPRKVEHVLFGYTGNMGKGLLGVYDTIVGNQSLNTNLNEAPVISGFTAIPYKQSKTVNDFYDKFDEQQRLNEEFKLTKKKPDGYDPALYKRMTKAQQELSKINKQERAAIDDPKMDSGIREQKQLGYQQQRLSVVRRVMGQ